VKIGPDCRHDRSRRWRIAPSATAGSTPLDPALFLRRRGDIEMSALAKSLHCAKVRC